jgi:methionyl-tRNA formyltransferase
LQDLQALPDFLATLDPALPPLGILASYGQLIRQDLLDRFEPLGILNIHPSLLPKYRGPSPIESAILDGATETGVSIMKLVKAMDAGPIYTQRTIPLTDTVSKADLYTELSTLGIDAILDLLPDIIGGKLQPTPQSDTGATYTQKLDKSLSPLDPAHKSALQLSREVRALLGFPRSRAALLGVDCIIITAHVATTATTPLDLLCADGQYLVIDELLPAGSKPMPAKAFLAGHLR